MNRPIGAILLTLALALAGLTATGAVDTLPAPADDVELTPSEGPNAEFATLTDDDKLALNVDRLNRGAETEIAAVFSLTYTGAEPTTVWLTDESQRVTFTALSNSIEGEANAVTLQPGESISVGLRIETTGAVPELSAFTVNARVTDENGEIPVNVRQRVPGFVEIDAANVPPNRPVTVNVAAADSLDNATVEEIGVVTTRETTVDLNVSTNGDPGENAPPVDVPNRAEESERAIGYLSVSHETPDEAIGGATFEFTVQKETLDARGLEPADVQLYRFTDGTWNPVPTSVVGESPDTVRFRADSPGLSVFAVAPAPGEAEPPRPPDEPDVPDQPDDTSTATETPTTTDTPTGTPTDTPTAGETPTATPTETPTATDTAGTDTTATDTTATDTTATDTTATDTTATDTAGTETATETPAGEPFGFPTGPVTVVAAIVAVLVVIGLYRVRTGD